MIWLSNSVFGIDPAFLRRFDLILEMPDLPLKNKSALITQLVEGKLSPAYVQHFAKVRSLTPGDFKPNNSGGKGTQYVKFC